MIIAGLILVFLLSMVFSIVGPIDRTPVHQKSEYDQTQTELQHFAARGGEAAGPLKVGWSKINITPKHLKRLAGYGRRYNYTSVHDSLYTRVLVFDNGTSKIGLIDVDLIMFPRMVVEKLNKKNKGLEHPFDYFYFTATHTHTGFGNWEPSFGGQILFGDYDSALVNNLANAIFDQLKVADRHKKPAKVGFDKMSDPQFVANFVDRDSGLVDPFIRVIKIVRDDRSQAVLASYSAHPTNIGDQFKVLSRDYPGYLVDTLESRQDIDFALFVAGMVGSHRTPWNITRDFTRVKKVAFGLAGSILDHYDHINVYSDSSLAFGTFKVFLAPSQLRLTKNLRLRDWVFRKILGPLDANIQLLKVGNILLMGMPCDFSGDLNVKYGFDQRANKHDLDLLITSFNSKYIGYISDDRFYDTSKSEEEGIMNWTGPGNGHYFAEIVMQLIDKME